MRQVLQFPGDSPLLWQISPPALAILKRQIEECQHNTTGYFTLEVVSMSICSSVLFPILLPVCYSIAIRYANQVLMSFEVSRQFPSEKQSVRWSIQPGQSLTVAQCEDLSRVLTAHTVKHNNESLSAALSLPGMYPPVVRLNNAPPYVAFDRCYSVEPLLLTLHCTAQSLWWSVAAASSQVSTPGAKCANDHRYRVRRLDCGSLLAGKTHMCHLDGV